MSSNNIDVPPVMEGVSEPNALPRVDVSWLFVSPKKRIRRAQRETIPKRRVGRPSVRDKFPETIPAASRYIRDNGFRAHRRRQESMGSCGSTLADIRQHVQTTVPGLQESHPKLSDRTVARWMMPPNRSFQSSKGYAGLIDARVPAKDNSERQGNENSHFYSSRVRYAMECASKYNDQVLVYSADNKNKVKVGDATLAVDRRIKIRRFFPTNDQPLYRDHDFPTPGYLLTPCGYLELLPSQLLTTDNHGREHYVFPQQGPATIFLRSPHSVCNIASHLNDLHSILSAKEQPRKSVLFLVVDGGCDFNVNHVTNVFYYSRFFRDADLDALLVTSYCPGDSALNPIEHLWAPCTHALTSVYLPASLPGETRPPSAQTGLTPEERRSKEKRIFDSAMNNIKDTYWRNMKFCGHNVNVVSVDSAAEPVPYGRDYNDVKKVLGGSVRVLKDHIIKPELSFCMNHIDRRVGTLIFTKCRSTACEHCRTHPERASPDLLDCLRNFPSPQPSSSTPGHFMSFAEAVSSPRVPPCEHLPTFREKGLGRCPHCKYVFTSKKDVIDHRRKIHM